MHTLFAAVKIHIVTLMLHLKYNLLFSVKKIYSIKYSETQKKISTFEEYNCQKNLGNISSMGMHLYYQEAHR